MDMAQSMGFSVHPLKEETLLTAAEAPEGMLVVVGGDGSLLRQVPAALRTGMPLWGVHGGTVGFLTESTEETFAKICKAYRREPIRWKPGSCSCAAFLRKRGNRPCIV